MPFRNGERIRDYPCMDANRSPGNRASIDSLGRSGNGTVSSTGRRNGVLPIGEYLVDSELSGGLVGSGASAGGSLDVRRTRRMDGASTYGSGQYAAGGVFEIGEVDDLRFADDRSQAEAVFWLGGFVLGHRFRRLAVGSGRRIFKV